MLSNQTSFIRITDHTNFVITFGHLGVEVVLLYAGCVAHVAGSEYINNHWLICFSFSFTVGPNLEYLVLFWGLKY